MRGGVEFGIIELGRVLLGVTAWRPGIGEAVKAREEAVQELN